MMAERVGFAPLLGIETKNLRDFAFLTIRRIRSKAWVETRVEHAEGIDVGYGRTTSLNPLRQQSVSKIL